MDWEKLDKLHAFGIIYKKEKKGGGREKRNDPLRGKRFHTLGEEKVDGLKSLLRGGGRRGRKGGGKRENTFFLVCRGEDTFVSNIKGEKEIVVPRSKEKGKKKRTPAKPCKEKSKKEKSRWIRALRGGEGEKEGRAFFIPNRGKERILMRRRRRITFF